MASPKTEFHQMMNAFRTEVQNFKEGTYTANQLCKCFKNLLHQLKGKTNIESTTVIECFLLFFNCLVEYDGAGTLSSRINFLRNSLNLINLGVGILGIKNEFVRDASCTILECIFQPGLQMWIVREVARMFTELTQLSDKNIRYGIVRGTGSYYIGRLMDLIPFGDYEFQTMIVEIVYRLCDRRMLSNKIDELYLKSDEQKGAFLKIDTEKFDSDTRTFLNLVNDVEKNVMSLLCHKVYFDDIQLKQPPELSDFEGLWVDFNIHVGTITIFFDDVFYKPDARTNEWGLITIFPENISDVSYDPYEQNPMKDSVGKLTLKSSCHIMSTRPHPLTNCRILTIHCTNTDKFKEIFLHGMPKMSRKIKPKLNCTPLHRRAYNPLDVALIRKDVISVGSSVSINTNLNLVTNNESLERARNFASKTVDKKSVSGGDSTVLSSRSLKSGSDLTLGESLSNLLEHHQSEELQNTEKTVATTKSNIYETADMLLDDASNVTSVMGSDKLSDLDLSAFLSSSIDNQKQKNRLRPNRVAKSSIPVGSARNPLNTSEESEVHETQAGVSKNAEPHKLNDIVSFEKRRKDNQNDKKELKSHEQKKRKNENIDKTLDSSITLNTSDSVSVYIRDIYRELGSHGEHSGSEGKSEVNSVGKLYDEIQIDTTDDEARNCLAKIKNGTKVNVKSTSIRTISMDDVSSNDQKYQALESEVLHSSLNKELRDGSFQSYRSNSDISGSNVLQTYNEASKKPTKLQSKHENISRYTKHKTLVAKENKHPNYNTGSDHTRDMNKKTKSSELPVSNKIWKMLQASPVIDPIRDVSTDPFDELRQDLVKQRAAIDDLKLNTILEEEVSVAQETEISDRIDILPTSAMEIGNVEIPEIDATVDTNIITVHDSDSASDWNSDLNINSYGTTKNLPAKTSHPKKKTSRKHTETESSLRNTVNNCKEQREEVRPMIETVNTFYDIKKNSSRSHASEVNTTLASNDFHNSPKSNGKDCIHPENMEKIDTDQSCKLHREQIGTLIETVDTFEDIRNNLSRSPAIEGNTTLVSNDLGSEPYASQQSDAIMASKDMNGDNSMNPERKVLNKRKGIPSGLEEVKTALHNNIQQEGDSYETSVKQNERKEDHFTGNLHVEDLLEENEPNDHLMPHLKEPHFSENRCQKSVERIELTISPNRKNAKEHANDFEEQEKSAPRSKTVDKQNEGVEELQNKKKGLKSKLSRKSNSKDCIHPSIIKNKDTSQNSESGAKEIKNITTIRNITLEEAGQTSGCALESEDEIPLSILKEQIFKRNGTMLRNIKTDVGSTENDQQNIVIHNNGIYQAGENHEICRKKRTKKIHESSNLEETMNVPNSTLNNEDNIPLSILREQFFKKNYNKLRNKRPGVDSAPNDNNIIIHNVKIFRPDENQEIFQKKRIKKTYGISNPEVRDEKIVQSDEVKISGNEQSIRIVHVEEVESSQNKQETSFFLGKRNRAKKHPDTFQRKRLKKTHEHSRLEHQDEENILTGETSVQAESKNVNHNNSEDEQTKRIVNIEEQGSQKISIGKAQNKLEIRLIDRKEKSREQIVSVSKENENLFSPLKANTQTSKILMEENINCDDTPVVIRSRLFDSLKSTAENDSVKIYEIMEVDVENIARVQEIAVRREITNSIVSQQENDHIEKNKTKLKSEEHSQKKEAKASHHPEKDILVSANSKTKKKKTEHMPKTFTVHAIVHEKNEVISNKSLTIQRKNTDKGQDETSNGENIDEVEKSMSLLFKNGTDELLNELMNPTVHKNKDVNSKIDSLLRRGRKLYDPENPEQTLALLSETQYEKEENIPKRTPPSKIPLNTTKKLTGQRKAKKTDRDSKSKRESKKKEETRKSIMHKNSDKKTIKSNSGYYGSTKRLEDLFDEIVIKTRNKSISPNKTTDDKKKMNDTSRTDKYELDFRVFHAKKQDKNHDSLESNRDDKEINGLMRALARFLKNIHDGTLRTPSPSTKLKMISVIRCLREFK